MKRTFLLTGAAVLLVGAAWSQPRGEGDFRGMDADGDGQVSRQEFQDGVTARFASMDTDSSGAVSKTEFLAPVEARFTQMDADGDGFIDDDEKPEKRGRFGRRRKEAAGAAADAPGRDADGDGRVSLEEALEPRTRAFAELDENGDAALDQAEFVDPALARFEERDTNDDGVLTREELREAFRGRGRRARGG